jgi:hypothetical protein
MAAPPYTNAQKNKNKTKKNKKNKNKKKKKQKKKKTKKQTNTNAKKKFNNNHKNKGRPNEKVFKTADKILRLALPAELSSESTAGGTISIKKMGKNK